MRVLHVIPLLAAAHGGPTAALMGLTRAQRRAGLDVRVLSTFRGQDSSREADELRGEGIPVDWIGPCRWPLLWSPRITPAVRRAIADTDVVHIHTLWEAVQHIAAVESRRAGKPYIFRPCGMLDPWSLQQGRLKKSVFLRMRLLRDFNAAAAMHYTTDIERDNAVPLALRAKPIVVPNGVDLTDFASLPPRDAFRSRFPQIGDRPLIIMYGRVDAKKGFDLMIPALAKIEPRDAMLLIAGPDIAGYTDEVRRLAAAHRVGDRVIFAGMLRGRERVEALTAADVFALPSYQENFGIAVIEALAAGCPVVLSDQVALHRQTTAAGVGASVPLDVDTLASTITRWLGDTALHRAAADKAPGWVRENFDWDAIARAWAQHYQTLTQR